MNNHQLAQVGYGGAHNRKSRAEALRKALRHRHYRRQIHRQLRETVLTWA